MVNNTQKQKRKKLTIRKIANKLAKAIDWLTEKRYFLLIVIVLILLVWSCFNRTVGFLLSLLLLILYVFVIRKQKGISFVECVLVLFLVVLMVVGQNNFIKMTKQYNIILMDMIRDRKVKKIETSEKGLSVEFETISTPEKPKYAKLIKPEEPSKDVEINVIQNGNFEKPLGAADDWGHGLYSNIMRIRRPGISFYFINFLNAKVKMGVEKTEIGNALKIVHSSETAPHKVGIMEQYINVSTPGKYALSFKAKALDDFEEGAIWFSIRNDWVGPVTIQKKGPFEWEDFSGDFDIDETGLKTFTIISQGKGTVYLTDISLVKVSE